MDLTKIILKTFVLVLAIVFLCIIIEIILYGIGFLMVKMELVTWNPTQTLAAAEAGVIGMYISSFTLILRREKWQVAFRYGQVITLIFTVVCWFLAPLLFK
jgi:hypothetical protein